MAAFVNPALRILSALADPVRYALVSELMAGPATVSELVAAVGSGQSKVSNHLAILREASIVSTARNGRHIVYQLSDFRIAGVVEGLDRAAGAPREPSAPPDIAVARRCYDHLAGRLGVQVFAALVRMRALRGAAPVARARKVRGGLGEVALGSRAGAVFETLDVDLAAVASTRRQFASACLDWTENEAHLGGALGAALMDSFVRRRWVLRRARTRALRITPTGANELRRNFGLLT